MCENLSLEGEETETRVYLGLEGEKRNLYFQSKVEIPRMKHGKRQEI